MSATAPEPISTSPLRRLLFDIRTERRMDGRLPPGPTRPSFIRTQRFARDPLPVLLEAYERYGPVFGIRILHVSGVFMLGPEANHYMTVTNAANFSWRWGSLGDLIPLLGDGMLTIDGGYHRWSRRIMLPAFHRERIAASVDLMVEETERALDAWPPGGRLDLYAWTRALALRVAMRALFGFDPDRAAAGGMDPAQEFEHALAFYGRDYLLQMLRGPRTPWARMQASRRKLDRLIFAEVDRRRRSGERREDILSLLLEARDEEGRGFTDQQVRDQIMTLLFAGHDTTTSTVAFLFYELARHPHERRLIVDELDAELGGRPPDAARVMRGLPRLEMAMDETLRLYPPAWIGPRRARETFEFAGHRIPGGLPVHYCSWASHRLPDVFDDPDAFRPERFAPEAKAALPKGAYVPFGGGSRMCIGMRFGQAEIKTIAALVLQRYEIDLVPGWRLRIRQMPTLSPAGGMPVTIRPRGADRAVPAAA